MHCARYSMKSVDNHVNLLLLKFLKNYTSGIHLCLYIRRPDSVGNIPITVP
jgi:hypothetical protein